MKVKICGITTLDDALTAIDAGADMLGYNFYPPSKRYLTPKTCADIQAELLNRGMTVPTVGVFVNVPYEVIITILDDCDLDKAQLSGDEAPSLLEKFDKRAFKGIRPTSLEAAQADVRQFVRPGPPPALLVDAYRLGEYGGTGQTGDWAVAQSLAARVPILLAGGLRPDNVAQATSQVQPWGVDVASGVERASGVKDKAKMKRFIEEVHKYTRR